MKVAREGGVSLRVRTAGSAGAPPVLLIHAFPLDAAMWRQQLESLGDEFHLAAYDIRGFGRSDPGDGQYTMELFVDDLLAVLDALEWKRAVLCGLSMGGYIALRVAEREPDRLLGLVLCDTRSAADDDAGKLRRAAAIGAVKRDGVKAWAAGAVPALFGPTTRRENSRLVEVTVTLAAANPALAVCGAQLAMAGRTDTTGVLERLRVPALVVVGEEDALTPPDVARDMCRRIPEGKIRVLPGAGHLSSLERPGAFNEALRGYLRALRKEGDNRGD